MYQGKDWLFCLGLISMLTRIATGLQCHSCSGKADCETTITLFPQRSGRCNVDDGQGKCFIRKDPNNVIYWGCIDDVFWPGTPWRSINGCEYDWDRAWEMNNGDRIPMVWCFCDINDCNTSIEKVNSTDWNAVATVAPSPIPPVTETLQASCLSSPCQQTCDVANNSVRCGCFAGYILNSDQLTCQDIDECATNSSGCSNDCVNTAGSYECRCPAGLQLNSDKKTCSDINECSIPTKNDCQSLCINTNGSYRCDCQTGFRLNSDLKTCSDVNECLMGSSACAQLCINTSGSYRCQCFDGFVINVDGRSCDDVNECATNSDGCNKTCTNTNGSYECSCPAGLQLDLDRHSCLDLNECLAGISGCFNICTNTYGSYYCSCAAGFTLNVDQRSCDDINECLVDNGGCDQICGNTIGSFTCSCWTGYEINNTNTKTCTDFNECASNPNICAGSCFNTLGSYFCYCNVSDLVHLSADQKSCQAICPTTFQSIASLKSCYRVVTPNIATKQLALTTQEAEDECQSLHPLAHLASLDSMDEKNQLANMLAREPKMLDGWQGWWTSGRFVNGINQFAWQPSNKYFTLDSPLWGFRKTPYSDTCVWIMSISYYNYTIGNYDCWTTSGYVCEIELPVVPNVTS